jgi:hypothetical protein
MPTAPQSDSDPTNASPLSPIRDGFALSGVSALPDPATHAYRKDLADASLAGRVIASHYAEPLPRHLTRDAIAHSGPSHDSTDLGPVALGDAFQMLDCSLGWAWGYLADGRVAYLEADVISA